MSAGRPSVIDEAAFRRDWAAGFTLVELAALHGISTSTVSTWSVKLGCPSRTPGRKVGSTTVDNSPQVLTNGEWIADGNGVMRWHPRAPLARPKPPPRKTYPVRRRPPFRPDEDAFREDWASGAPIRDLAVKYDASMDQISMTARRLGLPYRSPGRRKSA
jgi:hypothetical protein